VTITAVTGEDDGQGASTAARLGSASRAREISNIVVPNGTPGYEPGEPYRKMGWNASDTRPLSFSDCRVQESNLLGRRGDGFKNFLHILDGGRIGVAAMAVGLAQGALDEALAYAKERRAFGQPISKFQAIQAKIADLSAQIESARLLTYRAAIEKDRGRSCRFYRDAKILTIGEGTDEVQQMVIARQLGC
jgi:short/branched chain acyl-CoA dehydrogenase